MPVTFDTADPVASPDAIVQSGTARFTILAPDVIRLEWSEKKRFEDRASLTFINRRIETLGSFVTMEERGWLTITTEALQLRYKIGSGKFTSKNLEIRLFGKNTPDHWKPGMENTGNLGGTVRTLDMVSGATPLERGVLSREGWTLLDDSGTPVLSDDSLRWPKQRRDKNGIDWYFFTYGHEYQHAMQNYTALTGAVPVPPRWAFGSWWSRYWAYSAAELKELIGEFHKNDVPLDVLVVDMDWHLEGWTGYTWNRELFPDPKAFLAWVHEQGLHVTLNLHPHQGVGKHEECFVEFCEAMGMDPASTDNIPFDIANPAYMKAYFGILHHPLEEEGVDFWWIDWQQGEVSGLKGLDPLFWLNHLHWRDMETRAKETGKRPLLFSRWGGLGSHRYQTGFSGDTYCDWASLAFQPYFTTTAANVAYPFWSHDIGGHQPGPVEGELYLRWVQFAVFNPILRTHATKNPGAERRIWSFDDVYFQAMRGAFQLRYQLAPYIYHNAHEAWASTTPLLKPLYYKWPEEEAAYDFTDQYLFGADMLVAPVISPVQQSTGVVASHVWMPPGEWIHWFTGQRFTGPDTVIVNTPLDQTPVFVRSGAIIPMQRKTERLGETIPDTLVFRMFPGEGGEIHLYEDDGVSNAYQGGVHSITPISWKHAGRLISISIKPREGSFADAPENRVYEFRFPFQWLPDKVQANREDLPQFYEEPPVGESGWWYDAHEMMIAVRLKERAVSDSQTVTIFTKRGLERTDFDEGLRGRLLRLERAVELAGEQTPEPALKLMEKWQRITHPKAHLDHAWSYHGLEDSVWTEVVESFANAQLPASTREQALIALLDISFEVIPFSTEQGDFAFRAQLHMLDPLEHMYVHFDADLPSGWRDITLRSAALLPVRAEKPEEFVAVLRGVSEVQTTSVHLVARVSVGYSDVELAHDEVLFPAINAWHVLAPFDNPGRHSLEEEFPPEKTIALSDSYRGKAGKTITWNTVRMAPGSANRNADDFFVDLHEASGSYTEDAVGYGFVYLDSPREQDALLLLGSDDGVKVWLNNKLVHENEVGRAYRPREDSIPIHLRKGLNALLVKVSQGNGGWGFGAQLVDMQGKPLHDVRVKLQP